MDRKIIAAIVIILIIVIGAIYVLGTQSRPNAPNETVTNVTINNSSKIIQNGTIQKNNTTANGTPQVKISAKQAQQIAINASEDLGFPAKPHGNPILFKWTKNNAHTWVWNVPLEFEKGSTEHGSVYIDAMTGEVIMNE